LFGSGGSVPTKNDISGKYILHGLDVIKNERDSLKNVIMMRSNWLKKWYVPPSRSSDCYTCDAHAKNHNAHIKKLNQGLDNYNEVILQNEKKSSLSSKSSSQKPIINLTQLNSKPTRRPKMNLTRKKNNDYKVDSVARRQKLAAMLVKKKESQDRRKKSASMKKGAA
jgi:hypothetical protein